MMWSDFEKHSGYSFNKSHAVAYSLLSYWTAWLKVHYPLEFMYATLRNEKDNDSRTEYLIECKRMGIPLKLPHINDSSLDFTIEGKGIRFGLTSIKYISALVGQRYLDHRPYSSFKEIEELTYTKGKGLNSRALKAMNAVGALTFPDNPADEENVRKNLYEYLNLPEFNVDVPSHFYAFLDDCDDHDDKGVFIYMGVVNGVRQGKGWSLINVMDGTGTAGFFDEQHTGIEKGKSYVILVANNRVMEFVPVDEIRENKAAFVQVPKPKTTFVCREDEFYVLAWKPRKTKAGANMGTLSSR